MNKSFLQLWGYGHDKDVLGKPLEDFLESKEKALQMVKALYEKGGWTGEMGAVSKDGSLLDLHISASMVNDADGRPVCMMASLVDISEKREMEEAMLRSEKLSSMGQLAAGLAHELKNPLAVISSCAQFCMENMELAAPGQ